MVLVEARGRVTPKGDELVAAAEARLAGREAERAAVRGKGKAGGDGCPADPVAYAEKQIAGSAERHGAATDWGRAFAAAARRMALAGFDEANLAAALAACPQVRARKGEETEGYAERMAAWACGGPRRRPR